MTQDSTPDYLEVKHTLACGHELKFRCLWSEGLDHAIAGVKYWLGDRTKRHDCALVSDTNLPGYRRKT